MTLETELIDTRRRWMEAKKKGDLVMCNLWERVGNSIKVRISNRVGLDSEQAVIENIFGGKLTAL